MELTHALRALKIESEREPFEPFWSESLASLPPGGPAFLKPAVIAANRDFADLPDETQPLLEGMARRVEADPALLAFIWHCDRLLYEKTDYERGMVNRWPSLEAGLGEDWGLFYLLIALDAVPRIRAVHRARAVPEDITRGGCVNVRDNADIFRAQHGGRWGLHTALYWLRNHTVGDLFRVGRMQYMVRPFRPGQVVYRHRASGRTLALAEAGVRFNPEGFIDGPAIEADRSREWEARLAEDGDGVTGFPISPLGHAVRREVRLRAGEWARRLAPGDSILEMHIPPGGGMTPERCRDSMTQALAFFPRYFPDRPFRGFACRSWIFNTQFQETLSPDANLCRFQRELYLFPIPASGVDGLDFVYHHVKVDPRTAPRDTSLRRAMLERLDAGERLRGGGMFFLTEDMDRFGAQPYRRDWPALGAGLGLEP